MKTYIGQFIEELTESILDFFAFWKKEKELRWIAALLILVLWGIKLVGNDIFIDSEIMSLEPYNLLHSLYGSKRFGLIATKKIFHIIRLVPYLSNILFMFALWGVVLFFCFCLQSWYSSRSAWGEKWGLWLTAVFFVSAPSLAEQYAYTLQVFEITLAMLFCLLAAFCADKGVCSHKSPLWYILSMGFLIWGLGSYQGLSSFYIALVLISFLGSYERYDCQNHFLEGLIHLFLFLAGFIAYTVIGNLLCEIKAGDSSYVNAMFLWGNIPARECFAYIWDEFRILFMGAAPILYHPWAGIVICLGAFERVFVGLKSRQKGKGWYLLAVFLLAFSPMYISLITGMRTPVRGQLAFPLVFSFFAVVLWHMAGEFFSSVFKENTSIRRASCGMLIIFFCYQAWGQGMKLVQLNQTLHDSVTHDMLTAQRMYMGICEKADREDMQNQKVVFVGVRDARLPQAAARGESIGHSFFDFGVTEIGVTNRAIGLLNYLGMNVESVSAKDYLAALEAAEDKPCWPAADSIFKLGDCVVVKLSD